MNLIRMFQSSNQNIKRCPAVFCNNILPRIPPFPRNLQEPESIRQIKEWQATILDRTMLIFTASLTTEESQRIPKNPITWSKVEGLRVTWSMTLMRDTKMLSILCFFVVVFCHRTVSNYDISFHFLHISEI